MRSISATRTFFACMPLLLGFGSIACRPSPARRLTSVTPMVNGDSAIRGKYGGQDKESVAIVWKFVIRLAISGDKKLSNVAFILKLWIGRRKTSDRNRTRRRTAYF